MANPPGSPTDWTLPRPTPASYWVVPGRLLAGEHPGSRSRADAMDRVRAFLAAGVTCFIDLTEPHELPSYESLLPFSTPAGRRIEYLRAPILDHGLPDDREHMVYILGLLEDALQAGHLVYVHCRAGIGRSATVIGCWLASRAGDPERAYEELQVLWQQAAQSAAWPRAPETDAQAEFVRSWRTTVTPHEAPARSVPIVTRVSRAERIRGALLGLAVGDAVGAAKAAQRVGGLAYTQPTALALCLAASLRECGRFDARDQVQRYLRWEREGYCAADGKPGHATPDVSLALGTSLWRGMTMAGSHDPRDRSTASLSRAIAVALHGARDPAAAVALAAESSRPTHQAPAILDACRLVAAMIIGAIAGAPVDQVLTGHCEPAAGLWASRPLKREFTAALAAAEAPSAATTADPSGDVVLAIARARRMVRAATDFETAVRQAGEQAADPAPVCALAGALFGALHGAAKIPEARLKSLAGVAEVERVAAALAEHDSRPGA